MKPRQVKYDAHWGTLLVVMSVMSAAICLVIGIMLLALGHGAHAWLGWLLIAVVALCAVFTVRGYAVTGDAILVRRLFWSTRLPLSGLRRVSYTPEVMTGSWRLCGNGGLFAFSGLFRNKVLGNYRAFVTDLHETVVLQYDHRTIVLSPTPAADFVRAIESILRGSASGSSRPSASSGSAQRDVKS